jgi:hypothetical protein
VPSSKEALRHQYNRTAVLESSELRTRRQRESETGAADTVTASFPLVKSFQYVMSRT